MEKNEWNTAGVKAAKIFFSGILRRRFAEAGVRVKRARRRHEVANAINS